MSESENNFIDINKNQFEVVEELDTIPIADSFVKTNKLKGTTGHGEGKLYVGAKHKYDFDMFFRDFSGKGLFLKKDFIDYLNDAKFEYEQQEQQYRDDISVKWQENYMQLNKLSDNEFFTISRAVPQDKSRYYIKSNDNVFDYFREIVLPIISYVSILKLKDVSGNTIYLFRPSLSYSYNPYYHPAEVRKEEKEIEKKKITPEKKKQLVEARQGQGNYRKNLLNESSECIITRVNDERILIASHIKPWVVANDIEKIDFNNGLVLTPTYDKLFDQGFISFEDDGEIIVSPYISPLNIKKLNLIKNKKYIVPESDKRKIYLKYHRENIFKN